MPQKQITIVAAIIRNEKGEILLAKRHQQTQAGEGSLIIQMINM
jgi:hypothetical protein